MDQTQRAKQAKIDLGNKITFDGYEMPNGEYRVGVTGASQLLGYGKRYFSEFASKAPNKLKALQGAGFQGSLVETLVDRADRRGAAKIKTISLDDLQTWVSFEALIGNKYALALMAASFREVIKDRFDTAFGRSKETESEKKITFDTTSDRFLELERIMQENRDEVDALWLPGDSLYYPELLGITDDDDDDDRL